MTAPYHHHHERHFMGGDVVRDVVLGMSDGLTVPFALAAGLTGAVAETSLIVVAGVAEIAAGAIAMGLGGYLAGKSQVEHYASERARERREVSEKPAAEEAEVLDLLEAYGVKADEAAPVVRALRRRPEAWVDFMMRFELGLERPDPTRALWSAITIGASYVVGGLIPLASYIVFANTRTALTVSVAVTLVALLVFGYVKGRFTGTAPMKSAIQTALIGSVAAGAAFGIARVIA